MTGLATKLSIAFAITLFPIAHGQTSCGMKHPGPGAFLCYPNPSEDPADAAVPGIFHLSAQGNVLDGQTITRYTVLIDGRPVYQNRLTAPSQQLSIEGNLKYAADSGSHSVRVVIDGAGTAEASGIHFYSSIYVDLCDPFSRFDARTCKLSSTNRTLEWSPSGSTGGVLEAYTVYSGRYGQNLKSLQADVADSVAVDGHGNLYAVLHESANIELRKYKPDGSIVYDALIASCGAGFLSVAGVDVDSAGRAWIVGNTTACLVGTPNAVKSHVSDLSKPHGFIALLDTSKPPSAAPEYLTYLSDGGYRISGVRADSEGNIYVAGAASADFPHESVVTVGDDPGKTGFVAVLNSSTSRIVWSTLLHGAAVTALALDGAGNVFLTGRAGRPRQPAQQTTPAGDDALVVELSDLGRRLSYVGRFGSSGTEEGRAIAVSPDRGWVLVGGATDSRDFLPSQGVNGAFRDGLSRFLLAIQPCKTGMRQAHLLPESDGDSGLEIAMAPALDAVASAVSKGAPARAGNDTGKPAASVEIAAACTAPAR